MARPPEPRLYSFDELAAHVGMTINELALDIGASGASRKDYRENGLSAATADRLAVRLGFHPSEIWPEWYSEPLDPIEDEGTVECFDEKCSVMFDPVNTRQRFCSKRCQRRRFRREQYRSDPERREAERRRQAIYKRDCAAALAAAQRRRWWADPEASRAAQNDRRARQRVSA